MPHLHSRCPKPLMLALITVCGLWISGFFSNGLWIGGSVQAASRPNILWISCEDISPNLGCYGDPYASTPNLDRLAKQGVRFTRAFTPAGVCAVVRASVISGMYAPAIGAQHMRSRIVPPPFVKAFPEYLRAAGYYCTNRSKTDYQFDVPFTAWDAQGNRHKDWAGRAKGQPFFSVINLTVSHESKIRHSQQSHDRVLAAIQPEQRHDPDKAGETLPPYIPNTPEARLNWAWYHDNISFLDKQIGDILARLQREGLADNTLVIYWSDHGMGMPRGKRWIYDSGTHVPVMMRWPGKLKPGSVREDLVTMIDLVPTTLNAAGIDVPNHMQGRILIGKDRQPEPEHLFFHRDRMDEAYDLMRGIRDRRFKYIRNFMPEKTYAQGIDYMDKMPAMQQWRRLHAQGKLKKGQDNWFAKPKPIEELYDTATDPYELNNLADKPAHQERLASMRKALEETQLKIGDTGLLPEPVIMQRMRPNGEYETTAKPAIQFKDGMVALACATEGASIGYRLSGRHAGIQWLLYSKPFKIETGQRITVRAGRIGFKDSPDVSVKAP